VALYYKILSSNGNICDGRCLFRFRESLLYNGPTMHSTAYPLAREDYFYVE
jgi:hypothetical protein